MIDAKSFAVEMLNVTRKLREVDPKSMFEIYMGWEQATAMMEMLNLDSITEINGYPVFRVMKQDFNRIFKI